MWFKNMVWPSTWLRRFVFAMSVYQPVLFLTAIVAGWVRGLSLAESMLLLWVWAFVMGSVISLIQASGSKPGASFWKPFFLH